MAYKRLMGIKLFDSLEKAKAFQYSDPLICNNCNCEMELIFYCFNFNIKAIKRFKLKKNERIPNEQFSL